MRNADTGRGCKSSNSVGGAYFSGSIRCLKDTGNCVSDANHLSEIIRIKYCGGKGSYTGTKNLIVCSS